MTDKRFWSGMAITLAWGAFFFSMLMTHCLPTKLNEWGDFFAGFFAPLAFLWLVLGYMQQGEELRSSAEALRDQAEELKKSVVQQSALVDVSREQLQQEISIAAEERERRKAATLPKFVFGSRWAGRDTNRVDGQIKIRNVGNTALNVTVRVEPHEFLQISIDRPSVINNDYIEFNYHFTSSHEATLEIYYLDIEGIPGQVNVPFKADLETGNIKFGAAIRY